MFPFPFSLTITESRLVPMAGKCIKEAQATVYCRLGPRYCFFLFFFIFQLNTFILVKLAGDVPKSSTLLSETTGAIVLVSHSLAPLRISWARV